MRESAPWLTAWKVPMRPTVSATGEVLVGYQRRVKAAFASFVCLATLATEAHPTEWASRDGASSAGVAACVALRAIRGQSREMKVELCPWISAVAHVADEALVNAVGAHLPPALAALAHAR